MKSQSKIDRNAAFEEALGSRNPFGVMDVPNPNDFEVARFAATTTPGGPISGDPGSEPPVAPDKAPDMSPDPGLPQPASTSGSGLTGGGTHSGGSGRTSSTPQSPSSFWSRVTNTLEFWK